MEIGSAEGSFTEVLATRCDSLFVVDLSPTALARTQNRCAWGPHIRFSQWNLLSDQVPGAFDLIVATGVLEYFTPRRRFMPARVKLIDALKDGGYLLIESTRSNPIVENSEWGKFLIRGVGINNFVAAHPALSVERQPVCRSLASALRDCRV